MRVRIAFGLLVLSLSVFSFVGSASACNLAHLTLPPSAGPGDTVSFSISSIEPGATYDLRIAGVEVSGTNDTPYNGVSGTFTMPDLGSTSLTVTGFAHTHHAADGDDQDPSSSMTYQPAAPEQPATAPTPSHASAPAEKTSAPKAHHRRPPQPIAIANHAAQRQRHDSATTGGAGAGAAPADAVGSEPGPTHPSSGSGEAKNAGEKSSGVPHNVLNAIGSTTKVGPADVPTIGLLLIAVIVIAGAALAAFVIYLLRRGPDPEAAIKAPAPIDPDPVEAELQEIIADEMARQLLSDLELGEPTVTSR
jgi:hypothetical protein